MRDRPSEVSLLCRQSAKSPDIQLFAGKSVPPAVNIVILWALTNRLAQKCLQIFAET